MNQEKIPMKMTKEDILKKLREIADGDVKINKHLNVDERIRWWWSWEAAEQLQEYATTKILAEMYFDGIKACTSAEIVADELSEYDEENLNIALSNFKKFLFGAEIKKG